LCTDYLIINGVKTEYILSVKGVLTIKRIKFILKYIWIERLGIYKSALGVKHKVSA